MPDTQSDPLEALAAQHGASTTAPSDPLALLAAEHGAQGGETLDRVTVGPAVTMQTLAKASPVLEHAAEIVATSPNTPKIMAKGVRVGAGLVTAAGAVGKIASGDPMGAAYAAGAISPAMWAGGKTGWLAGKLLQNVTAPVANALATVAPYLQAVSTLSGAQGITELAQIAEPSRKDVSIIGHDDRSPAERDAHPALLNLIGMKAADAIKSLVASGVNPSAASHAYMTLKSYVTSTK